MPEPGEIADNWIQGVWMDIGHTAQGAFICLLYTSIAINTDRKAPVFDIANIGLVGDWYEILPRLLKTVKEGT